MEHAECRELLRDARCQLSIYKETNAKTKFLRHIQNPNSPYVDPDSISCELERVFRDRSRLVRFCSLCNCNFLKRLVQFLNS